MASTEADVMVPTLRASGARRVYEDRGGRTQEAGSPDTPAAIQASKRYLTDFGRLRESTSSEHELYDAMTELYPDWASHQTWLVFGLG
jgi:hypothetical protein